MALRRILERFCYYVRKINFIKRINIKRVKFLSGVELWISPRQIQYLCDGSVFWRKLVVRSFSYV